METQELAFYSEGPKNEALSIVSYEKNIPLEVLPLAKKMAPARKSKVLSAISEIFQIAESWSLQVEEINIESIEDTKSIELAEIAYKNTRRARLSSMRVFKDARAEVHAIKVEYDTEDKLLLKTSQIAEILFKEIETKAYDKSQYVEKYNLEQKKIRTEKRLNILLENGFDSVSSMTYRDMEDDMFDVFLGGLKYKRQQLQEEEIAEAAREEERRLAIAEKYEIKRNEDSIIVKESPNVQMHSDDDFFTEMQDKSNGAKFSRIWSASPFVESKKSSTSNKEQMLSWVENFGAPFLDLECPEKQTVLAKFAGFKTWAKLEISKMKES